MNILPSAGIVRASGWSLGVVLPTEKTGKALRCWWIAPRGLWTAVAEMSAVIINLDVWRTALAMHMRYGDDAMLKAAARADTLQRMATGAAR